MLGFRIFQYPTFSSFFLVRLPASHGGTAFRTTSGIARLSCNVGNLLPAPWANARSTRATSHRTSHSSATATSAASRRPRPISSWHMLLLSLILNSLPHRPVYLWRPLPWRRRRLQPGITKASLLNRPWIKAERTSSTNPQVWETINIPASQRAISRGQEIAPQTRYWMPICSISLTLSNSPPRPKVRISRRSSFL